jgi:ferredoxin
MERRFGEWTVRIDPTLCVGFGDCITAAETLFELDEEGIVRFCTAAAEAPSYALLVAAVRSCPVDALSLHDDSGAQLAP